MNHKGRSYPTIGESYNTTPMRETPQWNRIPQSSPHPAIYSTATSIPDIPQCNSMHATINPPPTKTNGGNPVIPEIPRCQWTSPVLTPSHNLDDLLYNTDAPPQNRSPPLMHVQQYIPRIASHTPNEGDSQRQSRPPSPHPPLLSAGSRVFRVPSIPFPAAPQPVKHGEHSTIPEISQSNQTNSCKHETQETPKIPTPSAEPPTPPETPQCYQTKSSEKEEFPISPNIQTTVAEQSGSRESLAPAGISQYYDTSSSEVIIPIAPTPALRGPTPNGVSNGCSILLILFSQQNHDNKQHRIYINEPSLGPLSPTDDRELFQRFRYVYNNELRSFWQRYLSLKGLRYIAILEYTVTSRPRRVEIAASARDDIMFAYKNPGKLGAQHEWINWVTELRASKETKFALEFVEGWKGEKIVMLGAVPWVGSCLTAIIWSIWGGDVQVALAVASFILTASGSILALLAILSNLDG